MRSFALFIFFFSVQAIAQNRTQPKTQPQELGQVSWYRNYNVAAQQARTTNKPILILFQEVPGCATCRNYGMDVLSNPLLVEAIEDLFIPLAIYNNKGGDDKKVLDYYQEPSWNNPVVRIVDSTGTNIVERLAGHYSTYSLYKQMKKALSREKKLIPPYFELLGEELSAESNDSKEEVYYEMYCFWSGEKALGAADGVLGTDAGFVGHSEVVKVTFDKQVISEDDLTDYAEQNGCKKISGTPKYRGSSSDQEYYLKHSNYRYLPLSELQKTKINSALAKGKSAEIYLSPSQKRWLDELTKNKARNKKELYQLEFKKAWKIKIGSK